MSWNHLKMPLRGKYSTISHYLLFTNDKYFVVLLHWYTTCSCCCLNICMAQEAESDCDDCTIHSEAWTGVCVHVKLVLINYVVFVQHRVWLSCHLCFILRINKTKTCKVLILNDFILYVQGKSVLITQTWNGHNGTLRNLGEQRTCSFLCTDIKKTYNM